MLWTILTIIIVLWALWLIAKIGGALIHLLFTGGRQPTRWAARACPSWLSADDGETIMK